MDDFRHSGFYFSAPKLGSVKLRYSELFNHQMRVETPDETNVVEMNIFGVKTDEAAACRPPPESTFSGRGIEMKDEM